MSFSVTNPTTYLLNSLAKKVDGLSKSLDAVTAVAEQTPGATGPLKAVDSTFTSVQVFSSNQTGLAVTIDGTPTGAGATGTVDTDGSGLITALTITEGGQEYVVGETVTIEDLAGPASGAATTTVTAISIEATA